MNNNDQPLDLYQPSSHWDEIGAASRPGSGDDPGQFGADHAGAPLYPLPRWSAAPQFIDQLDPCSRVLDLGSGNGLQVARLTQYGFFAVGCDISQVLLQVARENHRAHGLRPWRLVQWDGWQLPFAEAAFEQVTTNTVLQHVVDQQAIRTIFLEVGRILKPAGKFLISELVAPRSQQTAPHVRMRSMKEYAALAAEAGLIGAEIRFAPSLYVSLLALAARIGAARRRSAGKPILNAAQNEREGFAAPWKRPGSERLRQSVQPLARWVDPLAARLNPTILFAGQAEMVFRKPPSADR